MKFHRITAVVAALMVLLSVTCPEASSNVPTENDAENNVALENNNLTLSFSENGSFRLTDKITGEVVYSRHPYAKSDNYSSNQTRLLMNSELSIEYYNVRDALISNQQNTAYSNDADIRLSENKDSVKVNYNFKSYDISFDIIYKLFDEYFTASIDLKSLSEKGEYSVNSISLLPALFSGDSDDSGYIFVPDGSGALINFNNNSVNKYNAQVYGEEISADINMKTNYVSDIRLPVFGIVKNGFGMLGIIEEGAATSEISAGAKNSENYYNFVYSSLQLNSIYEKNLFAANDKAKSTAYANVSQITGMDKYTVRYYLIGSDADYVKMAGVYRNYLINQEGLKRQINKPVLNIEVIGAIDVKANMLGFTYYKNAALTSYAEALELLEKLNDSGVKNIQLNWKGWSNNGLSNKSVVKKAATMKVLGGKNEFRQLNSYAKNNGVTIDYDIDMLRFYEGSKKYKVSSPFNETLSFYRYLRSVYSKDISKRSWFLLSPAYIEKNMSGLIKSMKGLNVDGVSFSSVSNMLYSDFNRKNTVTRNDASVFAANALKIANKDFKVSGETANAYALPYLAKVYSSPCYTSGYKIFDKEIPFYQIVLHGVLDITAESQFISTDRKVNFLKAVETGTQLLYTGIGSSTKMIVDTDYDYLYGTDFSLWFDDAVEKYKKYMPLLEKVYDSTVISHTELLPNVYETVFENGVGVIVNYNDSEESVKDMVVGGYDFIEVTASE